MPPYFDRTPTGIAQGYLAQVDSRARHCAHLVEQVELNAGPAFLENIPAQQVCIPADISRERELSETLAQIREQVDQAPYPYSVIVSANYPHPQLLDKERSDLVSENRDLLRDTIRSFGDMALSYFEISYPPVTPIGRIRAHTLTTAVRAYANLTSRHDVVPEDVLLTSWDADTLAADRCYFAETQISYGASGAKAWKAHPAQVVHARLDPELFPNANLLLACYDLAHLEGAMHYPQHFSINLGAYAMHDFEPVSVGELGSLWEGVREAVGDHATEVAILKGVTLAISGRRLLGQMASSAHCIGYEPLTSSTAAPTELTHDVTDDYVEQALPAVASTTLGRLYLLFVEKLHDLGVARSKAPFLAKEHATRVLYTQLNTAEEKPAVQKIINGAIDRFQRN